VSTAFDVVFGIFVAIILAVAVLSVRWAVQRDRVARAAQNRNRSATGGIGARGADGPAPRHRGWRSSPAPRWGAGPPP